MHQKPFLSSLEILPLKRARKGRFTQAQLAARAGLSVPTVRLVERGGGGQGSLVKLTAALGLTVEGRNLPPGPTLGARLAALRKRRGFTQRSLAAALELAPATVNRLENTDASSVAVLCRVMAFLGAGTYLAPPGAPRPFYTHAGNASVHERWRTPPALLRRLYAVFGTFDLDPCSPTANRRKAPVRARMHLTEADDGLLLPWHGRVFVNPPCGRDIRRWVRKGRREVLEGRAELVAALLPARTDTRWWHDDIAGRAYTVLLRGRLSFGNGTAAPFPSALVIWGADTAHTAALLCEFPDAWRAGRNRLVIRYGCGFLWNKSRISQVSEQLSRDPPRYDFRLEDLRAWHLVAASCRRCRHSAAVAHALLLRGRPPYTRLSDLERHLRCRRCGARGTAALSVRPRPRD